MCCVRCAACWVLRLCCSTCIVSRVRRYDSMCVVPGLLLMLSRFVVGGVMRETRGELLENRDVWSDVLDFECSGPEA